MRYVVWIEGDAQPYLFENLKAAAIFAVEENDGEYFIWDAEKNDFLTGAEVMLACIAPRGPKVNWQKVGF